MVRDLDAFVVGTRLHVDELVRFLREIEPLLNEPRPSIGGREASSVGTMTTEAAARTTKVDLVTVREGKNLKGRFLGIVLGTVGKGVLRKAFDNSVTAIEARSNGKVAAEPAATA